VTEATTAKDVTAGMLLTETYPDLESLAMRSRDDVASRERAEAIDSEKTLKYASRLVDLSRPRRIAVVGCGHRPKMLRTLLHQGHDAVGIEPVESYVRSASEYLEREDAVLRGVAEDMPLPDASQDLVVFENVLEHVDSVSKTLAELYRVTAPGGVTYVKTNSRYRFSPSGYNGEFRVPFYNWFPALVKESIVHRHLHFDPSLAHYTTRPAVHWFDFAELCRAGREAGFARFYSLLDVVEATDPAIARSRLRRLLLEACKSSPWLRAAALTQIGGYVFMYRRAA
jgi:SAM-dependent methyltransferase